nr:hypothetical protein [Salmonella enterica]
MTEATARAHGYAGDMRDLRGVVFSSLDGVVNLIFMIFISSKKMMFCD